MSGLTPIIKQKSRKNLISAKMKKLKKNDPVSNY
jgi:hypothetical protein